MEHAYGKSITRSLSRTRVLGRIGQDLLFYRKGGLYLGVGDTERFLCRLPLSRAMYAASKVRLLERLLRLEPRVSRTVGDTVYFSSKGGLFKVESGACQRAVPFRQGMGHPLALARISGIDGFSEPTGLW